MKLPFGEILGCVRAEQRVDVALDSLISIGKHANASPLWDHLPEIDVDADVAEATAWLESQLTDNSITGIYLGLDTLNEDGGNGKNVEIGYTRNCDPDSSDIEWVYSLEGYGQDHIIRGLEQLHRTWFDVKDETDGIAELARLFDYTLFLGYSGLVLAAARSSSATPNTRHLRLGLSRRRFTSTRMLDTCGIPSFGDSIEGMNLFYRTPGVVGNMPHSRYI